MKRVLVTGASGFIGRHSLPLLVEKGYEVYAVSSKASQEAIEGVHWIHFDLLGTGSMKEMVAKVSPSHLLHFAWVTTPGVLWRSADNLKWIKASIELLEAFAEQGGKRVVFSGTCAEYDWSSSEFEEQRTSCRPLTLYGSSKLALHLILDAFAKEIGFSQAWGRIFYLYGPHEYSERFVPSVIRGLLEKQPIPCSHGNQIRDFLYVKDVANAFVTLLDSDVQGVVNIASGIGVSLKQIIHKITTKLGDADLVRFGALESPMGDPDSLIASTTRLKDELGWRPQFSLEEGIEETISWWKN